MRGGLQLCPTQTQRCITLIFLLHLYRKRGNNDITLHHLGNDLRALTTILTVSNSDSTPIIPQQLSLQLGWFPGHPNLQEACAQWFGDSRAAHGVLDTQSSSLPLLCGKTMAVSTCSISHSRLRDMPSLAQNVCSGGPAVNVQRALFLLSAPDLAKH